LAIKLWKQQQGPKFKHPHLITDPLYAAVLLRYIAAADVGSTESWQTYQTTSRLSTLGIGKFVYEL